MSKADEETQEIIKEFILLVLNEKETQLEKIEFIDAIAHQKDERKTTERKLLKKAREIIKNTL